MSTGSDCIWDISGGIYDLRSVQQDVDASRQSPDVITFKTVPVEFPLQSKHTNSQN